MGPFWLRVLILCAILVALLLSVFGLNWQTVISVLGVLSGAIPEVIKRTPSLYLPAQRFRYFLLNAETTWELGLRFGGDFSSIEVDALLKQLATAPNEVQVLERSDKRWLVRFQRVFTVEFLLTDEKGGTQSRGPSSPFLYVTVFDQVVSYRRSKKMLEDSIIPLIEFVREKLHASAAVYTLRVRFEGPNPFFGMYVQQLKADLVSDFQFEFHLPSSQPNEYVRVGRDDIEVVAQSPERFRRAALAGLTFSGVSG
jgi:hypothetical protein